METLANGLNAEVTTTAPCCIALHIVVPADTVKKTYSSVLAQYSQKATRPGFRAGHTPKQFILSMYGKAINAETTDRLVNDSLREAVTEKKLRVAADFKLPDDKAPDFELGKEYDFTATTEVFPEFDLPQYQGLDIVKVVEPVADKQVDEATETLLRAHGKYAVVERPAEAGDMLKVDYTTDAAEDLKSVPGASYLLNASNSWQMMREPESIPGVTAALAGLKAEDTKDAAITFPADFRIEALRSKTINYHFTIREVHGFTPAEQTPELFKQYGCEDLAGMKKLMRQRMEDQSEHNAVRKMNDEILAKLVAGLDFPLPPSIVAHQLEHAMEHEMEHFKRDGLTEEQIAEKRAAKEAEVRTEIEREFRTNLVLERIADVEKLQVPPEDFYQYCYGMAQQSGMNPDEFMKKISGNSAMLNNVFGNLLRMKALEFVREHVKGAQPTAAEEPKASEASKA